MKNEPKIKSDNPLLTEEEISQRYDAMMKEKIDSGVDPLLAWIVTCKQVKKDMGVNAAPAPLLELLTRRRDLCTGDETLSGLSTLTPTIPPQ